MPKRKIIIPNLARSDQDIPYEIPLKKGRKETLLKSWKSYIFLNLNDFLWDEEGNENHDLNFLYWLDHILEWNEEKIDRKINYNRYRNHDFDKEIYFFQHFKNYLLNCYKKIDKRKSYKNRFIKLKQKAGEYKAL